MAPEEFKHFSYNFKQVTNLSKMYQTVLLFLWYTNEKKTEFLDHCLKPLVRSGKSYIKDIGAFLNKLISLGKVPDNVILVTTDVVGLYISIPHKDALNP